MVRKKLETLSWTGGSCLEGEAGEEEPLGKGLQWAALCLWWEPGSAGLHLPGPGEEGEAALPLWLQRSAAGAAPDVPLETAVLRHPSYTDLGWGCPWPRALSTGPVHHPCCIFPSTWFFSPLTN